MNSRRRVIRRAEHGGSLRGTRRLKAESRRLNASEIYDLVVVCREVYRVVNPLDDVATVAGDERCDVDVALLQSLFGVERGGGALQLAEHRAVALHLRAVKARAQAFELVLDLFA